MNLPETSVQNIPETSVSINNFPTEILQEIFIALQRSENSDGSIDIFNPETVVRVIMQVSSYWRTLAITYCDLWSNFSMIVGPRSEGVAVPSVRVLLNDCIVNSGTVPLNMKLQCNHKLLGQRCLEMVALSSDRWRDVSFSGSMLTAIRNSQSDPLSFPILKKLSITGNLEQTDIFKNSAPILDTVKLIGVSNPHSKLPSFPWHQITRLILETQCVHLRSAEYGNVLKDATRLQFLSIYGDLCSPWVTLPTVKSLEILDPGSVFQLEHLIMPNLHSLRVKYGTIPESRDVFLRYVEASNIPWDLPGGNLDASTLPALECSLGAVEVEGVA